MAWREKELPNPKFGSSSTHARLCSPPNAAMRVKVECGPPLPSLKVWFIVPAVSTIAELKVALRAELPGLQRVLAEELTLLLDGFELIDSNSIDVIRDGELITVKQTLSKPQKRKKIDDSPLPSPKRAKSNVESHSPAATRLASANVFRTSEPSNRLYSVQRKKSSPQPESDSDSSDTSESSSESSSGSGSDSSDEEHSSSSDSDTASAPSVQPSKPTTNVQTEKPSVRSNIVNHVPPGQGKATTQNRNARRRRKKTYERLAAQAEPSSVNDIPLGTRSLLPPEPAPSSTTVVPTIMMASLSNKNKRKGFKRAMANALPKKIVFSGSADPTAAEVEQAPLPFSATPVAEMTASAPNIFPRLIPPSEKQEKGQLPVNLFVTSIDVEEGMHTTRKKGKGKKEAANSSVGPSLMEAENIVLDYGEMDDHIPTQREPDLSSTPASGDWSNVEKRWDRLVKIGDGMQLAVGTLVGWKALGINPSTFTPEFLVNVGRIINVGDNITVRPIYKPGDLNSPLDECEAGDGELSVHCEEEIYNWKMDVCSGDWRVI